MKQNEINVLVVEDEYYSRESLIAMIHDYDVNHNINVSCAENGEEGLKYFLREHYDLVLTDIYMPKMNGLQLLEKIRAIDRDVTVIILSAYSDFSYAKLALQQNAGDYLLKPIDPKSLADCFDAALEKKKKKIHEVNISGEDAVSQFLLAKIQGNQHETLIGRRMFEKIFPIYALACIYRLEQIADDKEAENWMPKQEDIAQKLEKIGLLNFRIIQVEYSFFGILMDAVQKKKISKLCDEFAEEDGLFMGLGAVHTNSTELENAWTEAVFAISCRTVLQKKVLLYERVKDRVWTDYSVSVNLEKKFDYALNEKNGQNAAAILDRIFNDIPENISIISLQNLYSQLRTICLRCLYGGNKEEQIWKNRDKNIPDILRFSSINEIREFFQNIIANLCNLSAKKLNEETAIGEQGTVQTIEQYVAKHYGENISLKEIASEILYMNRDYVSHVFSEKKGMHFSDYLMKVRIEEAKKELLQTNLSITDIASNCGYNDFSYFIRIFRLETGMTPKKYRQKFCPKEL